MTIRVATVPLQLQSFRADERRTGGIRQLSALRVPRGAPAVAVIGTWLYVVGGGDGIHAIDSVERALIGDDGSIGPFAVVDGLRLVTPRDSAAVAIIAGSLFIVGGYGEQPLSSVERAEIQSDGSLGPFVEAGILPSVHYSHGAVIIGRWVYLVGGNRTAVVRGFIRDDGMLGPFEDVPGVTLPGLRYRSSVALVRDSLYVIGGKEMPRGILRAPVHGDGRVGSFATAGMLPGNGRFAHWHLILGDNVYLIGGVDSESQFLSSIDRAVIAPDGSLGPFEIADSTLATPRAYFHGCIVGDFAYLIGGENPGHLSSVERASIHQSPRPR